MAKKRQFRQADYAATESTQITLGEALPEEHLARFIVGVVGLLDLSEIYSRYSERGGSPYAPEVVLALVLYGYATGVFSSRKIERATHEAIPFRYIAGNMHPDHDTLNQFCKDFLDELKGLFVQVLLVAHFMGYVKLGNISIDGSKVYGGAVSENGSDLWMGYPQCLDRMFDGFVPAQRVEHRCVLLHTQKVVQLTMKVEKCLHVY